MAGEVNWFPNQPNRFIVSGNELKLYEVPEVRADEIKTKTTEDFLIHTEKNYRFIKCIDPGYSSAETVVAVGLTTGKVVAINFDIPTKTVEFTPKNPKNINCLRCKGHESRVAVGFDKSKSEDCIQLWDTEKNSFAHGFGGSDSAISMNWDADFKCLLVGLASKTVKLFDPRCGTKEVWSLITKFIQGVEFEQQPEGQCFSGFSENVVSYFDIRNITERTGPLIQINTAKNVIKASWCHGKSKLGVVQADSAYVHVYDVFGPKTNPETISEPYYCTRRYLPFYDEKAPIADISWHPKDPDRMICVNSVGGVNDYSIQHDLVLQFDNRNNFVAVSGGKNLKYFQNEAKTKDHDNEPIYLDEVSQTMQQRALHDYGLIADIQQNGEVAHNAALLEVWKVLAAMYSKGCMKGLISILGISSSVDGAMSTRSEIQYLDWYDFPSYTQLKTFKSEQRQLSQALCGWNFEKNSDASFNSYLDSLCNTHEYTKAALIACFHLKLKQAVEVLTRSGNNLLTITAISIGNFNSDRNFLRSDMAKLYSDITDPYLRAIFAFLSQIDDHWDGILNEKKLPLTEKMAFACMYLSDSQLNDYIKKQIVYCVEIGDLTGILLTGATGDGIGLLQSYLDATEDVQTVSLIASRFFPNEQFSNLKIQYWIAEYRNLLNSWGFWELRAQFDIMMGNKNIPPKSVYLLCNFCSKSISSALQEDNRIRNNRLFDKQCPHCRKPLPRCSLCLLHMGTPTSSAILSATKRSNSTTFQAKPFASWFAWCQTCRHGGHTDHLNAWFAQYSECPVTACDCNCFQLDQPMPRMAKRL